VIDLKDLGDWRALYSARSATEDRCGQGTRVNDAFSDDRDDLGRPGDLEGQGPGRARH